MSDNKCAVCGDKASGYNFNAQSCVSCKAFFRRNALKTKQLKCPFDDKCVVNPVTRKFCSKCRLKKCFDIGMRKELILSEEEKQIRRNRALEKKKSVKYIETVVDSTTRLSPESSNSSNLDIEEDFMKEILNDTISEEDIEEQVKELESSINEENDEISADVYRKCLELDFIATPVLRPITDYQNNFNEMESNRLTELFSALSLMRTPFGEVTSKTDNWMRTLCVVADDFEIIIQRLVQSSKRLTFFNELCNDDQIALIKYGGIEVSCIRQVKGYDCQTQNLVVPGENPNEFILVKLDTIKEKIWYLYEANKKFYQKIGQEWDFDETILDLLTAIVFFNPDRPNLTHREPIRYLQIRYGSQCVATTKFLRLMNTMKYLQELYKKHIQLFKDSLKEGHKCGEEDGQESILNEIYDIE